MKIESFARARPRIEEFFTVHDQMAYTRNDIIDIFNVNKGPWKIAAYRSYHNFSEFIQEWGIVKLEKLTGQGSVKEIWRKPEAGPFDVGLTIQKSGYLCQFSAFQIHGLTLQVPKTVYVATEKYHSGKRGDISLKQGAIDRAFDKPQRTSSDSYRSLNDGYQYTFLQKTNGSKDVGVIGSEGHRMTDPERTLIDGAVRPVYSGGVFEVLGAFRNAINLIDAEKLNYYIELLDYIYPYPQLIGFYMERAGYPDHSLDLFKKQVSPYDFYLTYNLSNKTLDRTWRIYYPMGF